MSYITASDVKDYEKLLIGHDIDALILRSDDEMVSFAKSKGVFTETDISTPLDSKVKEYLMCWVCEQALRSNIGLNNNDLQAGVDRYYVKHSLYVEKTKELSRIISDRMITGDDENIADRATVRNRFRG